MSVWSDLAGQDSVVATLRRAIAAAQDPARPLDAAEPIAAGAPSSGMTSSWLFTGPPGSGRSNAARAFAAALQCPHGGCGACEACRTALAGTHADVELVSTSSLSHKVDDMRALVQRAARHPAAGRWQVVLLEDADRLTDSAANALLKAIEEPTPRTVWLLCAPTTEDVLPTIRSRCRVVSLRTPPLAAVAQVLQVRDGVEPAMAAFAARAAQGHIGRALRLATDEQSRSRRATALRVPLGLGSLPDCLEAAAALVEAAAQEAAAVTAEVDERERAELARSLGAGTTGRGLPAGAASQLKELERGQKARAKRLQRDALDRSLVDLASFYRDVLALQFGADVELVNAELGPQLHRVATTSVPVQTVRRIEAVLACREAVQANVAPLLAVERLTLELADHRAAA